ncbi:TIGR02680 family protein [Actinokineospora enzanensis]|uniref:TIGR02680 family protein n=1 Tax=Actinokineospora enzanensis TaxID=155975 RepID=UPI00035CAE2D|nr:TIGR02680 family protein [Actinokineospora enzanensis]
MTDTPITSIDAALAALLEGDLPKPNRRRFQPLRMGLIGIWQYDEQEFFFHDGRMVLRGRNGSGKTKVLEVTSPFLFDANLTARRLDPFGTAARSMRDNLLYGDRRHQIGYVWCEYGRLCANGDTEFITIGAGMRAQATKSGAPDAWYFLTEKRVGLDLRLYDSGRRPANERDLVERVGRNAVFQTADAYRREVGRRLFGLTAERFRSLVELLITLRRPKLSENFGVDRLTGILSDGLPPVDHILVDELARGFDELAREQEDLQSLITAGEEIDRFLTAYRTYARRMVRFVAAKVRGAVTRYDDVTKQGRKAAEALAEARQTVTDLGARAEELGLDRARYVATIRALEQRPEVEQHAELLAMEKQAAAARRQAGIARDRLTEAERELEGIEQERADCQGDLDSAIEELHEAVSRAAEQATSSGLRIEHDLQVERLGTDPKSVRVLLQTVIDARKSAIRHARELRRAVEKAQGDFDRAQATRDDLAARRDESAEEVTRRQGELAAAVEVVSTAVASWLEDCREHLWNDLDLASLLDAVARAGEPGAPSLLTAVRSRSNQTELALLSARAAVEADHVAARRHRDQLGEERDRLMAERELPPPPPLVMRRDRAGDTLPGAPLWSLVDFVDGTPQPVQDQVEAALLGAGLLDAWVTPSGAALRPDTLDTFFRPTTPTEHTSLVGVLRPAGDSEVPTDVVVSLLESIEFAAAADLAGPGTWVSADGGWSIGPLTGRTEGGRASYIGANARAESRRRALAHLDQLLTETQGKIESLHGMISAFDDRLERLRAERDGCPADDQVREWRLAVDVTLREAGRLTVELGQSEKRLRARQVVLATATGQLTTYASEHSLGTSAEALETAGNALGAYRESVVDMTAVGERAMIRRTALASALGRVERQRDRHEAAEQEHRALTTEAAELTAEFESRNELIGAEIGQVMAELSRAKGKLAATDKEIEGVRQDNQQAAERLGVARGRLELIESDRRARAVDRSAAVDEYDKLRHHGFLELAQLFGQRADEPATLTQSVDDARRAEDALRGEDLSEKSRNAGRNLVDERFRDLQMRIQGPDWRPWGDNDGDLFVVRVTHNGVEETVPGLRAIIEAEVDTRRGYLDDRERELFADVLLGRMGEHLRQCRVEAMSLCDRMNDLLRDSTTASGLQMKLVWEADPEAGTDVNRAINLLDTRSARFLDDESRNQLVGFLADRVRKAREGDLVGDWRVHLREALDYRKWSRFTLEVRKGLGDRWSALNDATHQQGSGGEKAVMLQLPLFVAAAAHYKAAAATAPRPVYLDEAFAGIDAEMRGNCMRLLTDLDLDFVLASHDEWGFHREVPGLVTYSLYRDPSVPGVLTTPFIWDGETSHRLDDPALVADEPEADGGTLFDD